VAIVAKCVAKMKKADELEMIDKRVSSQDESFEVYKEYFFS